VRHISRIGMLLFAVIGAATAIAAGCASMPLHTETSTSGIRAAEEVGALKVPRAALHLQLAKEELGHARRLAARGEEQKATSLLHRAEADAELAVALSREDAEMQKTRAAVESVRHLRRAN